MEVISEDKINRWIVPHLRIGKRGTKLQVKPSEIISAILSTQDGLPVERVAHQCLL